MQRNPNIISQYTNALFGGIKTHNQDNLDNLTVIKSLINAGADICAQNQEGKKAMQLAASLKLWDCVELIAKTKKSPKKDKAKYGDALIEAVKINRETTASILLKQGAGQTWFCDYNHYKQNYALHLAVLNKNIIMLQLLLQYNPRLDVQNHQGKHFYTPIQLAAKTGFWEGVEMLVDYDEPGERYTNVLRQAVIANKPKIVKLLRARIKTPTTTCLHEAVKNMNRDMVVLLLGLGAAPGKSNKGNETPLELACKLGYWDIAQILIERADVNPHIENALIHTIRQGNYTIAKLLLDIETPCDKFDSQKGNICLYWAITKNRADLVSLLLANGADPDVRNMDYKSSRDLAVEMGAYDCVTALDNYNPADSVAEFAEKSFYLFQQLMDNAVTAKDTPNVIKKIINLDQQILKNLPDELKEKRKLPNNINPAFTSQALMLSNMQNIPGNLVIGITNLLLNFPTITLTPQYLANLYQLQQQGMAEAAHLIALIARKQYIQAYVEKMHQWLVQFKDYLETTTWQIKVCGFWVEGKPTHVKTMLDDMEKMPTTDNPDEIFKRYQKIMHTLDTMPGSPRRHYLTCHAYRTKKMEMHNISFVSPECESTVWTTPPCIYTTVVQPTPDYTPPTQSFSLYPELDNSLQYQPPLVVQENMQLNSAPALQTIPPYESNLPSIVNTTGTLFSTLTDTQFSNQFPDAPKSPLIQQVYTQEKKAIAM